MPDEQPVISTALEGSDMPGIRAFLRHGARAVAARLVYGERPMRAVTFQAPGRGARRGGPRARAAAPRGRDRPRRGERHLRLGSAHLPRPRAGRARLHDRPRVRRHRARRWATDVERAAVGDRVLGCFHTACGTCVACVRGDYHRCLRGAHVRARLQARRPAGRPGRAAARAARQPHPAAGARGHVADESRCSPAT